MAASYTVVSQARSVQVLGPTRVLDVQLVGFVTHPTGIYAEYPVDWASWLADKGAQIIGALADAIEDLISSGLAVDGSYEQDLRPSGLIVDYIDFVVQYTPPGGILPPQTTEVRIPIGALIADADPFLFNIKGNPRDLLIEAYAALEATAQQ